MIHQKFILISYMQHYGGIETLVLRMCKWLYENNIPTILVVDEDRVENEAILLEASKYNVEIVALPFRTFVSPKRIKDKVRVNNNEHVQIITFTYPEYFLGEVIKSCYSNANIDSIFYVPHQYGLIMEFNFSNKYLKSIAKIVGKHCVRQMYRSDQIINMDDLCAKRLETEYDIKVETNRTIPLAMEIFDINYERIHNIFKEEEKNILTIARCEFPFKGYMFGLMDMFDELAENDDSITLTIIGDGPDFNQLKDAWNKQKYKSKIRLVGSVPYNELNKYFSTTRIYIGMGTTLLDAANSSVVGFPIGSYTYECKGYGPYYEDGMNLGGLHGEIDITNLVRESLSLTESEYKSIVEKQHEEIKRYYDIDSVMFRIDSLVNKEHRVNGIDLFVLSVIKKIISIKRNER